MARPKETFDVEITHVSYRDVNVRVWGTIADKDRDVVLTLTQEKAEALINDIKAAFEGIEKRKAELAEAKYQEYLKLKAQFETPASPSPETSADAPVVE